MTRTMMVCLLALAATPLAGAVRFAAVQAPKDPRTELREGFAEVSANVTKAAAMVPADKYGYRPVATVRTFGQIIGHVADSYRYYCSRAAGQDVQWSDPIEKGSMDKAVLVQALSKALEVCTAAYGSGTAQPAPLIGNLGHTSLHYGNLITYLRMLGLVPPSS